jgi:hypothetical protein
VATLGSGGASSAPTPSPGCGGRWPTASQPRPRRSASSSDALEGGHKRAMPREMPILLDLMEQEFPDEAMEVTDEPARRAHGPDAPAPDGPEAAGSAAEDRCSRRPGLHDLACRQETRGLGARASRRHRRAEESHRAGPAHQHRVRQRGLHERRGGPPRRVTGIQAKTDVEKADVLGRITPAVPEKERPQAS